MTPATLQRNAFKARAFTTLTRWITRLQAWPNRLTPPPFRLMQIGSAFWQSRALDVAARLDLATVLGDAALPVATLAERVGADAQALHRLLRLLVAMAVFDEPSPGVYANNPLSTPLRTDLPGSVRAMVMMHNAPEMSQPWFEQLEQGVRRGEPPFRLAHGQALYEWMDRHPGFDALFAQAMDQVEALTGDSFATEFDWRAFDRVIDVGGSRGAKTLAVLKRHAHLQAVVIDRAPVIQQAHGWWTAQGAAALLPRVRFESGDVLQPLPALPTASGRDAYWLSAVLHGFDDAACVQILRHVAAAATASGAQARIVVMELVMPAHRADLATASFDLQMFMATTGRERTAGEWQQVYERAGVQLVEVVSLVSFGQMMVLRPVRC